MQIPGGERRGGDTKFFVAAEEADRIASQAPRLLDGAVGVDWYEEAGNAADRAALALCRLRRARAGEKGGPRHGDSAVRLALTEVSTPALVWIASRAISYMDETGFPEAVEAWFPEDLELRG